MVDRRHKLKIEQVKLIPKMLEDELTYKEVAEKLGVSVRTIQYWIARLLQAGVKLNITRGKKPLKLDGVDK